VSEPRRGYLGLGSNEGDRLAYLQFGVNGLHAAAGIALVDVSPVYETDPVGGPPQDEYLNAVVAVDTALSPRELLDVAKRLEADAGRVPGERFGPRPLDVDVLLLGDEGDERIEEPDLVVPHPRLWERPFVLAPLADLAPALAAALAEGPASGWRGVRRLEVALVLPATQ
jgi:2-amino-4-hydroxy-6-hydroxymethyldihydropteridine diphosphokinase